MTALPAVFYAIATSKPARGLQQAAEPAKTENPYQNICPICLTPLRPGQVHVAGGYECQEAINEQISRNAP